MTSAEIDQAQSDVDTLDVYWRPGCPFCSRLLRSLGEVNVRLRLHNIWEDPDARAFVRAHNNGDETVPTVALGALVTTNPDPGALLSVLEAKYSHLIGAVGQ